MTDHELVLEHIANNQQATIEIMKLLAISLPAIRQDIDWIAEEHLRVKKEIQEEYISNKEKP